MSHRTPEHTEVEVFARDVNAWIIRTPGRQFPAAVVQGDSLSSLFSLAQSVLERARGGADTELVEDAEELRDQLWARLQQYEQVLGAHGMPLPYNRVLWPK